MAIVYGAVGVSAVRVVLGAGFGGSGARSWTARLMDLPAGVGPPVTVPKCATRSAPDPIRPAGDWEPLSSATDRPAVIDDHGRQPGGVRSRRSVGVSHEDLQKYGWHRPPGSSDPVVEQTPLDGGTKVLIVTGGRLCLRLPVRATMKLRPGGVT